MDRDPHTKQCEVLSYVELSQSFSGLSSGSQPCCVHLSFLSFLLLVSFPPPPLFLSSLSLFFSLSLSVSILEFTVEYYHHCCYHRSISCVDRSRQRWPRSRKSNERSGDFCAPTRLSAWMIWILRLVLVRTLNHGKVVYPSAEIALFGFRNRPVAQPIARFQVFSLPLSLLLFLIFVTCRLSLSVSYSFSSFVSLHISSLVFVRFSSSFLSLSCSSIDRDTTIIRDNSVIGDSISVTGFFFFFW